jgi:hypothetical protein
LNIYATPSVFGNLIGDENGNIELVSKLCELAEPVMPMQ